MKKLLFILPMCVAIGCTSVQRSERVETFCNPMNLSYRYCLDEPSRREAADPSMVTFKGEYYLFLSKSGGYFHSTDLIRWDLIVPDELPIESYAPTAVVINDELYFHTSGDRRVFKTSDPKSGKWQLVAEIPINQWDPMIFCDDDGRIYYYWGCSNEHPIMGVELDRSTFQPIGDPVACILHRTEEHGWERLGDYNEGSQGEQGEKKAFNEGAWMNRYNGRYYLQYATPGTEFKSYADGVYVSEQPLGPFRPAKVNPFACKPEGFANGAGHGSTFQDIHGNYWHIGTVTISEKHMFERRLALFPVFFDGDGEMSALTAFGDYPIVMPSGKVDDAQRLLMGWMLLSHRKPTEASSSLEGFDARQAVDENIRTYWSAATGNRGEYLSVDMGEKCTVHAVQVNFADHHSTTLGRHDSLRRRYLLECSDNGEAWRTLVDKSTAEADLSHDYISFPQPVTTRYVRLTNAETLRSCFSVSGLRLFGKSGRPAPGAAESLRAERQADRRTVILRWNANPHATGFNIRFGAQPDKLYRSYMVYDSSSVAIRSLSVHEPYYFAVDAFNEGGVTKGTATVKIE
ncbi:MAG: family 43 glycosylhydrolase [Prevotellaceae bacterium]|nr:family 43 glycosylhydrolase [Prevotellaceae bacterium]